MTQRKRIIMIEPSGQRGLIQYTYSLSAALTNLGYEILLITAKDHEMAGLRRTFAVQEVFNRFRTNPLKVGRVFISLRKPKPEIVHLQGALHPAMYIVLLVLIHLFVGGKLVYTAHEIVPKKYHRYHYPFLWMLYNWVDVIIVHTNHSRQMLLTYFPVSSTKCHVVPLGNYLFLEEMPELAQAEPGLAGQKQVLFFGIIEERKGLMVLIQAFDRIKAAISEAKLVIAGQPFEGVDKYWLAIDALGLESEQSVAVHFGYVPLTHIASYFRSAAVVVLPYLETTQSAVAQVAYAFGKPIVATRCGGLVEIIEDGRSGLLVPPGDSSTLAEAIIELLRDDELRQEMGQYGRHLAETKYGWRQIARQTQSIYEGNGWFKQELTNEYSPRSKF